MNRVPVRRIIRLGHKALARRTINEARTRGHEQEMERAVFAGDVTGAAEDKEAFFHLAMSQKL